jgi:hypothetical protein
VHCGHFPPFSIPGLGKNDGSKKSYENAQSKSIIYFINQWRRKYWGGGKGDDWLQVFFGLFLEYLAKMSDGEVLPAASVLVADCYVVLMLFYCHLIAGRKALFLSSYPVVAALSLLCSPPPPLPPLLLIMTSANDVWRQSPAFVLFDRASIAAAIRSSTMSLTTLILCQIVLKSMI